MALVLDGNGPITGLSSLTFPGNAGTVTGLANAAIPATKIGAGAVLQVSQSVKTDAASTSLTTWSDTGLTVTLTPTSSTSKFYITYDTGLGGAAGAYSGGFKLVRNSTDIYVGDAAGSRIRSSNWIYTDYYSYATWYCSGAYLDSPATTSPITYKLQYASGYSGVSVTLNYNYLNGDNTYSGRYPSQLTVMEIAA